MCLGYHSRHEHLASLSINDAKSFLRYSTMALANYFEDRMVMMREYLGKEIRWRLDERRVVHSSRKSKAATTKSSRNSASAIFDATQFNIRNSERLKSPLNYPKPAQLLAATQFTRRC